MMVLIRRGTDILLAMHRNSPARFFTALAGFVEAGESIEEAVHREVREEVGLAVRDLLEDRLSVGNGHADVDMRVAALKVSQQLGQQMLAWD